MPRTILGIDLGTAQIKLTRLERSGRRIAVSGQERLRRAAGGTAESTAEAVREAVEVMDLEADRTHLCLSSREALLLPLSFPFAQSRKIAEVLPYELENQMPVELSEYLWDFLPLDGSQGSSRRVLAAMVARQSAQEWLEAFEAAGLRIDRLDLDLAPLAAIAREQADAELETEAFLDAGWSALTLACRQAGRWALQTASPGLKALFGGAGPEGGQEEAAFKRGLTELVRQVRLTALAETGGAVPQRLTLLGGGAMIPELSQALERELGAQVTILGQPAWDERESLQEAPLTAVSAALCLQGDRDRSGFDLRPPEYAGRDLAPLWQRHGRALAISLGLVVLAWALSLGSSLYLEHTTLKRLESRLESTFRSAVPNAPPDLRPMQYPSVLRSRLGALDSGPAGGDRPPVKATELLSAISRAAPAEIAFQTTLLSFDRGSVRLNGLAQDYKAVDALQSALSQEALFGTVEIVGANVDSRTGDVTFSLRLDIASGGA